MPRERIVAEAIRVGTGSDQAELSQRKPHFIEGNLWRGLRGLLGSKSTNSISPVRSHTRFSSARYSSGSIVVQYLKRLHSSSSHCCRRVPRRHVVGFKRLPFLDQLIHAL